jgi:hypothetical protein
MEIATKEIRSNRNLTIKDLNFLRKNCADIFNYTPGTFEFFKKQQNDKEYIKKVIAEAKKDILLFRDTKDKVILIRRLQEIKFLNYLL